MTNKELHHILRDQGTSKQVDLKNHGAKKQHPFEKDAVDGWQQHPELKENLARLNKKFAPKRYFNWWATGGVFLLLAILFMVTNQSRTETPVQNEQKNAPVLIEKTDLLPEITRTENKAEQIVLKREFKILQKAQQKPTLANEKTETPNTKPTAVPIDPVDNLPLAKPILLENKIKVERRKKAKEISLHDFLLVDYAGLRFKPQITTQQLDLSGTAANLETKGAIDQEPLWRNVDVPYTDYIDKTMRILKNGNLNKTNERLQVILKSYPDDINALFYAGFCAYQLKEYATCRLYFEQVNTHPFYNFDEDAEWYIALSYYYQGDKNQASSLFKKIEKEAGYYAEQARQKRKEGE